jgi:hypothetical protein
LIAAALLALPLLTTSASGLVTWRTSDGARVEDERPVPVGSLQKPFVAKAWARAHPGLSPPRLRCDRTSRCWRSSGHGGLDIARALALSCNAYFRRLAADTPHDVLEAVLAEEGFSVPRPLSTDGAIGLAGVEGAVTIRPAALLAAYVRLIRAPWATGDGVRQLVLAGLRESPRDGTAAGLESGGFWAKTGTVPALDGRPLATSGWVIAVDDAGWAILGLLPRGTGREAARALGAALAPERPWMRGGSASPAALPAVQQAGASAARALPDDRVRVRLFEALRPRRIEVRNVGRASVLSSRGWVGPGAALSLRPGDRLEEGLWEVSFPARGLVRRILGALVCGVDAGGRLDLVAEMKAIEYVAGVLLAEMPDSHVDLRRLRIDLGAAVLRFLADGPRHGVVDACDTTHCSYFVGRGPRVRWTAPVRAVMLADPRGTGGRNPGLDGETWGWIRAAAREHGPRLWTAHCGGAPLSAHAVWGNGDRSVSVCSRHAARRTPWTRRWSDEDLARAFGGPVASAVVLDVGGVWTLRVGERELRFDEAHRRLAEVLGWDALPSPASRIRRLDGGWEAEGVGSGHRVGLCLGE